MKIRSVFALLISLLSAHAALAGGFLDLSKDYNKNSSDVTTIVAGGGLGGFEFFGVYDSTRYGEILVGHTISLGEHVTTTPYGGVEWLPGLAPKLRGMLITSGTYGSLGALSVIEFAGNTGNFNLQQLSYSLDKLTFSLVRHSVAGSGIRLDWKATSSLSLYVRQLERRTTVGGSYTF